MQVDFKIAFHCSFGEADFLRQKATVFLDGPYAGDETDIRFLTAVITHETLHLVLWKLGVTEQPEWVLDEINSWLGFWVD